MPIIPIISTTVENSATPGLSDVVAQNSVYKFMGCTILSVNMVAGFNGTPSSLSVSLVEDLANGDSFVEPIIPSIHAFSLPKGGVGAPIFNDGLNLNQDSFSGRNVPFYFCGICNNWTNEKINLSGKTFSVSLVDCREILRGVQCLLGGFALSQNIGTGTPRFTGVKNTIDVFGYWNYGLDSEKNEYGIPWNKIQQAIVGSMATVYDLNFQFLFTGNAFNTAPSWYRVNGEVTDLMSLVQSVAKDGGSDLVVVARKYANNFALIEFRSIPRNNVDVLFQTEIDAFISNRADIVISAKTGKEFKNEPDSSIVIGGMKNSIYVAWPSEYHPEMHLDDNGDEDYNLFPDDIKVRLFGGTAEMLLTNDDGGSLDVENMDFKVDSGAIFPFWGFPPDDQSYPLIEPFLSLDHLVFDLTSTFYGKMKQKIPLCKLSVANFTVRQVEHQDVFLDGDGDPDDRPFSYLEEYLLQDEDYVGYVRGLPLNTEVLRAALIDKDCFYSIYSIYYPDIADAMNMSSINSIGFSLHVDQMIATLPPGEKINVDNISILPWLGVGSFAQNNFYDMTTAMNDAGKIAKTDQSVIDTLSINSVAIQLENFKSVIYELVKAYANDHMGKQFMVCLPQSTIMQRIWNNLPVPTRTLKPVIEYNTDDSLGYFTYIPNEFDGLNDDGSTAATGTPEDQIRRRFMAVDGRFYAMAVMDWKPTGNINFNTNGINRAVFQDLQPADFRPNKIATFNPEFVCISCTCTQFLRRPDLALVEIPAQVQFDPLDSVFDLKTINPDFINNEFIARRGAIVKYFWTFINTDDDLRAGISKIAVNAGVSFSTAATRIVAHWSEQVFNSYGGQWFTNTHMTEFVMDLKAVLLPITSNWVSYGPWYSQYESIKGMVNIDIDQSLVPWNFQTATGNKPWDYYLNLAGEEKLARSIAQVDYLDTANIIVAGFPEYGLYDDLGYNSNITSVSVDFNSDGVRTTYNLATYDARPGTYRKSDYDDLSKARLDSRNKLADPDNQNLFWMDLDYNGYNKFTN